MKIIYSSGKDRERIEKKFYNISWHQSAVQQGSC